MIKLLDGHSLTCKAGFFAESMQLTLNQRQSTARMTIGPDAPEITVGEWLQDTEDPGAGIVWRVKAIDRQHDTRTRTLVLEHAISTLRDCLMFGEITPKEITGNTGATTCTADEAITYILNRQSDWVMGVCSYSVSNPYNFNGDDLFSALETVSSSLEDCWWSYDFSSYPFTISFAPKTETVGVELRECRNIQTAKTTIDRTPMFTRFYPIGKNNLHIDGDYVSQNEGTYGRKDKTETDQSISTKAELFRWANERIAKHCEPSVTMTVQALDLSKETGESLDSIVLGAMCRMPLIEYSTVIAETITQINYPDKIREPEVATVTLANVQEDVASIISRMIKSGGGGGRAAAKNAEEDHAWFEDTTDHVAMIAEGIAGEGAAEDWSRIAELLVDGNGIHQRVTEAQADIVQAYSLIDQTTTAIRIEIGTVASDVRSFIETTPEMIHAEVGYAVSGLAHSVIEQTATYIRMEVENAASAISSSVIEQTTEYVRTEVASVASGVAWSVITQTMTNIEQQIARKSKVYVQWTDPNDGVNVLYEGDIWIKRQANRTWNEANAAGEKWNQPGVSWRSKYGDLQYVWRNNKWNLLKDTSADVENEVKLEQNSNSLAIIGRAVDTQKNEFNSKLEVTAREIRSEVSTARSQIYSTITQTATNIRAEVANVQAGLQSSIEQTASSITTSVSAAKSSMYSVIVQTATQIRSEVANTKSEIQSSITVQANRIDLVVEGTGANAKIKPAQIVAAINNGQSSIKLSANHIDIDGLVSLLAALDIRAQTIIATGDIETEDGAVVAPSIQGSEAIIDDYLSVNGHDMNVADISISGNVMTITYVDGTTENFSKATALSGQWSGRNFTVTASPQGNIKIGTVYNGIVPDTSDPVEYTKSGNSHYVARDYIVYSADENGDADTIIMKKEVKISADAAYNDGLSDYYHSSYWKKPQDNSGVCKIPNETNTGDETWFTMNSMGITRAPAYKNSGGNYEYYGQLYYYDNSVSPGVYRAASSGSRYWYHSNVNKSGSTTVYY